MGRMWKFNNKDLPRSGVFMLTLNVFHTFSSISSVDFEHVFFLLESE